MEIKTLLDNLPDDSSVAITAADSILEELFSEEGGGTLFVKGTQLNRYNSIGQCDLHGLRTVLQQADPTRFDMQYFQDLQTTLARAYTFGNPGSAYSGAAIVKLHDGKPVLDAYYVAESSQDVYGNALLWKTLMKDFPTLAWRIDQLPAPLKEATASDGEGVVTGVGGELFDALKELGC